MFFNADLHIHSCYSRATSKNMGVDCLHRAAQIKGITVIGTGDFTHPVWLKELCRKLDPVGNGLFSLREEYRCNDVPQTCLSDIFFLLTTEISCIYHKAGKTRKIHVLVFVPDFESAMKISRVLSSKGNLRSDGRPILGLDAKELLRIVLGESPEAVFIPAHIWTPHFSVFGSASGFDSLEECFEELAPLIFAVETGLSSDPPMNWRLSGLDKITLISNSDAHSPAKVGREATIFDTEISYRGIIDAIKTRAGIAGTVEFFPENGKYHYDGHRACGIRYSPGESADCHNVCPVCGKGLTIGVLHRVVKLADRPCGARPAEAQEYVSLVPLEEIIAQICGRRAESRIVQKEYKKVIERLGPELDILMNVPFESLSEAGSVELAEGIARVRSGKVQAIPGYDGVYGTVHVF